MVFSTLPIALMLREAQLFFWPSSNTRFLTMTLALAISLITLFLSKKHNTKDLSKPIALSIAFFLASSLISSLLSNYFYHSMIAWAEFACYALMAMTLFRAFDPNKRTIRLSLIGLSFNLILILTMLLLKWNILEAPRDLPWVENTPFVNNIRHLGYLVCMLLPVGFYGLNNSNRIGVIVSIGFLSLAWALIFWMGGRGAFVGVVFISIVAWFVLNKHKHWLYLTALIGFLLSQPFWVNDPSLNLFRIHALSGNVLEQANALSANRVFIWLKTIEVWWQNAPIFGLGADSYRYLFHDEFPNTVHPHNLILQLLISYGLVGLFAALILLYQYLKFLWFAPKRNQLIGLCVLAGLTHSLVDGVLYHAFSSFLFFSLLPLSLIVVHPSKEPSKT